MAEKKQKTLLENAIERVKKGLIEDEIGYAVSDGQAFFRAKTSGQRKMNAQNHAFSFHPALKIKEVKGTKKIPKKEKVK